MSDEFCSVYGCSICLNAGNYHPQKVNKAAVHATKLITYNS
jgi:hypothetical protein